MFTHILKISVLLLLASCSSNTQSRSGDNSVASSGLDVSVGAKPKQPSDDNVDPPGYETGQVPVPITGTNLVEASAMCANAGCDQLVFSAFITPENKARLAYSKRNLAALGIDHGTWTIEGLECDSHPFNPRCKALDHSTASLVGAKPKGTLSVVDLSGAVSAGKISDQPIRPYDGSIVGNFIRIAVVGQGPTGLTAYGDVSPTSSGLQLWTEVWKDLAEADGLEFTNILYNGAGDNVTGIDNRDSVRSAKELCQKVDLRLPSIVEMCGTGYNSLMGGTTGTCKDGIFGHGVKNLTFGNWDWFSNGGVWSSSPFVDGAGVIDSTRAWSAKVESLGPLPFNAQRVNTFAGVLCAR